MGQVAFDTLQASEELETAGISREQARAISLVVRKSHEVADVATKRDLDDVRKDIDARFDKTDAQIADVRKDMEARFEKNEAQMQARFEKTDAQIADVRKDMAAGFDKINDRFEKLGMQMTIRLGLMVAAAVSIIAAILKM
ncbi:DUF1640 domain-containing protein [Sodalis endosymbiont of Spalangia cameroni]|uniref:DUF1640 domain-containing protein n=1 Tax=Sodalis praecaptivus TaxID=1239307 RepID=UPI0031F90A77